MMWGSKRKKPPPSSSSHSSSSLSSRPSLISHVFPVSWLSKLKQKNGDSELKPGKVKPKGKRNSPSLGSPRWESKGGGKFYGVDDDEGDAFWRLSFGDEDSAKGKKTGGVLRSVWYDSDEEFQAKQSSCGSCHRSERKVEGREGSQKLKGIQAARKVWAAENDAREQYLYASSLNPRNSSLKTIEEECLDMESEELSQEKLASDWQKLKEMKMQEVKSKGEKHRKSLYISRDLQRRRTKRGSKVRVCSPRTASRVETCKIKAIEDMTKAKLKTKKKATAKERSVQQVRTGLDSFAVVKWSFDPEQDFRKSMVEMIVEKKITRPEDLEELLACYLTLNSDEYHDIIIKVFRQVWFDVNRSCLRTQQQNEECCSN